MNFLVYFDFFFGVLLQLFNPQADHINDNQYNEHNEQNVDDPDIPKTAEMKMITATWDHAVNSKDKLQTALTSESKMIEADVITGHLVDESASGEEKTDRIPIMGHPPAIISDLSLKEFLDAWNQTNKILKLDFKSTEAFVLAIPIMENAFKGLPPSRLPWLNADILPGPGPGGSPGVDADTFLGLSSKNFPDSILSLGWTTQHNDYDVYSENYINDMADLLFKSKYLKPVTYAVRASFAVNSIPELQYLLETSPAGSTLTAWCSDERDVIDHAKLVRLVRTVGADRVYLDLPDGVTKTFLEAYATSDAAGPGAAVVRSALLTSALAMINVFR